MRPGGRCWLLAWALLAAGAGRTKEALGAPLEVLRCRALQEMDVIQTSTSHCYCYRQHPQLEWEYLWSTVKVEVAGAEPLRLAYITDPPCCRDPDTPLAAVWCALHAPRIPPEAPEAAVHVRPHQGTVCFSVRPAGPHSVRVGSRALDLGLILRFAAGLALLRSAVRLSRSPAFYYSAGTALGVLMTPVFLLLLARRAIPKCSTFGALLVVGWLASVYAVCLGVEHLPWLWGEHRMCVVGYVLAVGALSFAACYRRGRLAMERGQRLLAWALRLLALALTLCGAPAPQAVWAAAGLELLPRALRCLAGALRRVRRWLPPRGPAFRYLSEEEFREQAAAETARALEELRQACRRPGFPSWQAVARLRAPGKFADFVLGGSHLSPEETRLHEEQYSLGDSSLEEQPPECPAPGPAPDPGPGPAPAPAPPPSSALALSLPPLPAPAPVPAPACHSGPGRGQ
ncbi:nuclear envelope integral membrane protein 2 [Pipistrellus kuhlii]|uniref:nuclear envelope integral membrane protein 2 n=1 Tax=Pipistrellus kuhlii TaxID=59472 RepID=UPI001E2743A3|nr:nuclear envelope integral membrane protein 2 [Pipistrellus kuhlii]